MSMRIRFNALPVLNLALLAALLLPHLRDAFAEGDAPMLRGRGLQIVDAQGRVRASIELLRPEARDGAETVLLRLITERGRPSVKIGASEGTSGLSFAGPTGTRETYVILQSKGTDSLLTLRSEDGRERTLRP
jgi:hypothetical protein